MALTAVTRAAASVFLSALAMVIGSGCSTRSLLREAPRPTVGVQSPVFRQTMGSLITPGFVDGNQVETLNNGAEIFPAMLAAIRGATRTIDFETFVFYSGDIPQQFADALAERARAGVAVKVILDAVGASKSKRYQADLRSAGVQLEIYHSLLGPSFHRFDFRTHRKLLIVDGRVGFIGGVGIADDWKGNASSPKEWRDLHYRVRGPVVAQLQAAFNDNWLKTHHELLQGPDYFPVLPRVGTMQAKAFFSSPVQGRGAVDLMYHLAIASSRKSLVIETPYFLPDEPLLEALCMAARRGVRVRVLMPGEHIDQKSVRRASRKRWPKLLQAGVELYEYQPTMIHSKMLVADGLFVSVGSANFDPRSLRVNDEANLSVIDAGFARKQEKVFERDLLRAKRVNPEEASGSKPVPEKPVQAVQTPVEGQL